jgi:hypothetical protein
LALRGELVTLQAFAFEKKVLWKIFGCKEDEVFRPK